MIIFALFTVFLLGLSIVNTISKEFTILEKIGASFLIGIGAETIFMFILDVLGILFTGGVLIIISIICIILINYKNIINYKKWISNKKLSLPKIEVKNINLMWVFFFILTCYLVYASVAKSLYWPTFAYDNVAGYDLMGKAMAAEGKICNSLFEINNEPILGSAKRTIYPPLTSGSFAFCYLFNLETSKIISSLFFIFFSILFYGLLNVTSNHTISIVALFFTIITPELYAFTSLSTTNIPFAIYSSLGLIYLFIWFEKKKTCYLYLSAILIALSSWVRSEGIVFVFINCLFLFLWSLKNNKWWKFIIYSTITFSTFTIWNVYIKLNFDVDGIVFVSHPFWDYEKFSSIVYWVKNLTLNTSMYGISFYALLLFIMFNVGYLAKSGDFKKDNSWTFLFLVLFAFVLYTFIFYQMDNSKMDSIDQMMKASYKRGLFAFIPMIWFYVFTSKIMIRIIYKLKNSFNQV